MRVEYQSRSSGRWLQAKVEGFNEGNQTYRLDVQPNAAVDRIRPCSGTTDGSPPPSSLSNSPAGSPIRDVEGVPPPPPQNTPPRQPPLTVPALSAPATQLLPWPQPAPEQLATSPSRSPTPLPRPAALGAQLPSPSGSPTPALREAGPQPPPPPPRWQQVQPQLPQQPVAQPQPSRLAQPPVQPQQSGLVQQLSQQPVVHKPPPLQRRQQVEGPSGILQLQGLPRFRPPDFFGPDGRLPRPDSPDSSPRALPRHAVAPHHAAATMELSSAAAFVPAGCGLRCGPDGYEVGGLVEYRSRRTDQWIKAKILGYDVASQSYRLDVQSGARPDRIRPLCGDRYAHEPEEQEREI